MPQNKFQRQTSYFRNRERRLAEVRDYRRLVRKLALEAYGNKCACCGEAEEKFLTIDHKDNNGNAHRREIGKSSGTGFYSWLKQNSYPPNFQVLCYNCNNGKYRNGGHCPHNDLADN